MPLTNRLLIQVVAQLKPGRCGVSDHAVSLAEVLSEDFDVSNALVVLNSTETCDIQFPRIYCGPAELLESCLALSEGKRAAVLLHYSGYGFSPDGAPALLPPALKRVRESGRFSVGVYFHELYATSVPWRSPFWHKRRQQQVVRDIASHCDIVATNLGRHSDWLAGNAMTNVNSQLKRLPVFSNIAESAEIVPLRDRRPAMVVFGLPNTRRMAYDGLSRLLSMLNELGVEEILDIGPPCDSPAKVGEIPVKRLGELDVTSLGVLFSKSMFGFVPHPSFCLAKSGIFASFCANGAIPVLGEHFSGEVDGLEDGVHLVSPRTAKGAMEARLEHCSAAAWSWYSGHRRYVHAATYAKLLIPPSTATQITGERLLWEAE